MEGVVTHTPGPWKWWTSNSWLRLTSEAGRGGQEGGVLCPVVLRDGHPDVLVTEDDMGLIGAAPDLLAACIEIDRLSLVIESAVRNADKAYHDAVLAALKANRAAIALAKTRGLR